MLTKSKWVILVALVGILLVSGVALGQSSEESSDTHTLGLTIEEEAYLTIDTGSGASGTETSLAFTIDRDGHGIQIRHGDAGTPDSYSAEGTVAISYTSILYDIANTRTITATVDKDWEALGVEINAACTEITEPAAGRGGEVDDGDVYDHAATAGAISIDPNRRLNASTTVELIADIGSVEAAEAEITYTVSIENVSLLYESFPATATPITVTLTLNKDE